MEIKLLIFDLQGVIFTTGDNIRSRFISEGFDKDKISQCFDTILPNSLLEQLTIGEIDIEQYKSEIKKVFGEKSEYLIREYFSNRKPLSVNKSFWKKNIIDKYKIKFDEDIFIGNRVDMLNIIKELNNNYELCLFTANAKHKIEVLEHQYDFLKYFKYKIFTYEAGFDKPSDAIFKYLVDNIPYSPNECIYLDDKLVNISKGKIFGFNSVLTKNTL